MRSSYVAPLSVAPSRKRFGAVRYEGRGAFRARPLVVAVSLYQGAAAAGPERSRRSGGQREGRLVFLDSTTDSVPALFTHAKKSRASLYFSTGITAADTVTFRTQLR